MLRSTRTSMPVSMLRSERPMLLDARLKRRLFGRVGSDDSRLARLLGCILSWLVAALRRRRASRAPAAGCPPPPRGRPGPSRPAGPARVAPCSLERLCALLGRRTSKLPRGHRAGSIGRNAGANADAGIHA